LIDDNMLQIDSDDFKNIKVLEYDELLEKVGGLSKLFIIVSNIP
jgi:hypothetical protein